MKLSTSIPMRNSRAAGVDVAVLGMSVLRRQSALASSSHARGAGNQLYAPDDADDGQHRVFSPRPPRQADALSDRVFVRPITTRKLFVHDDGVQPAERLASGVARLFRSHPQADVLFGLSLDVMAHFL